MVRSGGFSVNGAWIVWMILDQSETPYLVRSVLFAFVRLGALNLADISTHASTIPRLVFAIQKP